jgi:hypothetical protein
MNEVPLLLSGGSLLVAVVSLWRSGRSPVLAMRTSVRKDVAELRIWLDTLSATFPVAVQSRERVAAAAGGRGGALESFRESVRADQAEVARMRAQLDEIERMPRLYSYSTLEAKSVAAQEVRTRVLQLQEKYAAAAAADEATRKHLRDAAIARANRPPPPESR